MHQRRLTLGLPVERKKERKKIREISEILRSPDQSTVSVKIAGESGPTFASYLGCSFPKVEMSPVCSFSSAIGWTKYRWGFKFLSSELGSLYYTVRSFSSNPIRLLLIDPSEILASLLLPRSDWELKFNNLSSEDQSKIIKELHSTVLELLTKFWNKVIISNITPAN